MVQCGRGCTRFCHGAGFSPRCGWRDRSDNGLSSRMGVDVFHRDFVLCPLAPLPVQGVHRGAGEVRAPLRSLEAISAGHSFRIERWKHSIAAKYIGVA